jgi:MoxR-like ATPase
LPKLLKGAPGIGKTDIIKQACADASQHLIISHPVVSDPLDYKGFSYVIDNEAHFLPFGNLNQLIPAQPPSTYFLDELGQAPASVQAAAMQLVLERRINGQRVSDLVTFLTATNRKTDQAWVSTMALTSRKKPVS